VSAISPETQRRGFGRFFVGGPALLPFCRPVLPPLEDSNRHFCRKSRFAESTEKVLEMRFHALADFVNLLIFRYISDKGRLPNAG